jgi:hypothetical protein
VIEESKKSESESESSADKSVRKETICSKLSFTANLRKFSVWVPLKAEDVNSKIMSLSFKSDFSFMRESENEHTYELEFGQNTKSFLVD